ncbi:MAG: bifunctional diaminohydroxyphosphoribosylaminopyrimidine deaminase/5-amino-6-(5-phosphoribosylamino)uracil reductase RibD, partial [Hyphomicrobiaceae bacterium]
MTLLPTPDTRHPNPGGSQDERMMRLALRVARAALGQTAPNPAVGAIIADEATGEVVARGRTQISGRPHAEAHALGLAGERARGKTMYVTLEPCSYHGRANPQVSKAMPCAEAILAAGMRRVVVATEDPNPEIAGQGLGVLRQAGVAVDIGVCREEARWSMAGHILRMTRGRPFVQLKVAVGADGLIASGDGAPVWVTGPDVRAYAHLLRARADAVLVGRKTVDDDDPELTCRLPGLANRSPRRVVLDTAFRVAAPHLKMFATARRVPILIFGAAGATPPGYPAGVEARHAPTGAD